MKRLARSSSVLVLMVCIPAWAAPDGRRAEAPADAPMTRIVGQSHQMAPRENTDPRMKGRMTPEERRRLRADVSDAGRNAYTVSGDRPFHAKSGRE